MNARSSNHNVKKMGEVIDSPTHRHIGELLKTLQLFTEWKKEAGKFKERFITDESYEDLSWMIFAVVGVASKYLHEDGRNKFDQGRSGSDVCEHQFANIRMKYQSANKFNCEIGTSNAQAYRSNSFTISNANTSGSRKDTKSELFSIMLKT